MAKSTRRPHRIYTIVMWLLSVIFAGFLIGFGSLVIKDLPRVDQSVTQEQFVDGVELSAVKAKQEKASGTLEDLRRSLEDARSAAQSAQGEYNSAKASLDNWLATRTATEASAQNPEVLLRTRRLETLKAAERLAERNVEDTERSLTQAQREVRSLSDERSALYRAAEGDYSKARRSQELRVFLFRLALTLPLLLVGGWMAARKRSSSYWPLYRGFVLFALFAFFVELVPYLPSYGGYVRYAVGIVTVLISSHFIIQAMRRYLERKQNEEARSEEERRQSIGYETALKKIAAKTCPGCDRSIVTRDGVETEFCVHCGIRLQKKCQSCGERNVSFHKFCLSCGAASDIPGEPDDASAIS